MPDPIIKSDSLELPGAYGGKLRAQWMHGGVAIFVPRGRVLITDPKHAELLAAFITRESEDDA